MPVRLGATTSQPSWGPWHALLCLGDTGLSPLHLGMWNLATGSMTSAHTRSFWRGSGSGGMPGAQLSLGLGFSLYGGNSLLRSIGSSEA